MLQSKVGILSFSWTSILPCPQGEGKSLPSTGKRGKPFPREILRQLIENGADAAVEALEALLRGGSTPGRRAVHLGR